MSRKEKNLGSTNVPGSDETARNRHALEDEMQIPDASPDDAGLQVSNKSGKHSSVEKLAASRPEFGAAPGANPVDGAFGDDPDHTITGRNAGPGTNQYQCSACGRYFNTGRELRTHETECRLAKAATASGREGLK